MKALRVVACLVLLGLHLGAADVDRTRRIQDRFLAPCCWQQSLALHDSDIAREMRAEIAGMVASGKNEEQIVDVYVARYGERILREPRGANWWWSILIPLATFTLATTWLLSYVARKRRNSVAAPEGTVLPALPDLDVD